MMTLDVDISKVNKDHECQHPKTFHSEPQMIMNVFTRLHGIPFTRH